MLEKIKIEGLTKEELLGLSDFVANQKWLWMMASECKCLAKELSNDPDETGMHSVNLEIFDPQIEAVEVGAGSIFSAKIDSKYFPVLAGFFREFERVLIQERFGEKFVLGGEANE